MIEKKNTAVTNECANIVSQLVVKARLKTLRGESVDNSTEYLPETTVVMPIIVSPTKKVYQCVNNFANTKNVKRSCQIE